MCWGSDGGANEVTRSPLACDDQWVRTEQSGYRRAHRPVDRRLVGGVAAGLGEHLGISVVWIRVGFIVLTWVNGAGILAYLLLWRFMPIATPDSTPGLESATRAGLRKQSAPTSREIAQTVSIAAIGLGVLLILAVNNRGFSSQGLIPILLGVVGVALVWRQLDDAAWNTWLRQTSGGGFLSRILLGLVLVVMAAVFILSEGRGWNAVLDFGVAAVAALVGVGLILGPWISSLWSNLEEERRQRIRSQERADMAAHLHDSVLQTLALLQKNADNPASVATLARRQERELRAWLYDEVTGDQDSLVAALRAEVEDVELIHRVAVEFVAVGDTSLNGDVAALVKAAREAMVNAAKHAGVTRVDVYAEASDTSIEVYVRDRGRGFDPEAVGDDRRGIKDSIVERLARHGGEVSIRSSMGEGTEVRLLLEFERSGSKE